MKHLYTFLLVIISANCAFSFSEYASLEDPESYDSIEGALEIPHQSNWSSLENQFTTRNMNHDSQMSCSGESLYYGTWFKFQATSSQVSIKIIGKNRGLLTFYDSDANPIVCEDNAGTNYDMIVESVDLIVGNWYYFSVSQNSNNSNYLGAFSIEMASTVSNDFIEGAIEVPHGADWMSEENEYTTGGMTSDDTYTCDRPMYYGTWFKFQATSERASIKIKNKNRGQLSLFNSSLSPLVCENNGGTTGDMVVESVDLSVGDWYYFTVSQNGNDKNYTGKFSIEFSSTVSNDFSVAAIEVPHVESWASGQYSNRGMTTDSEVLGCNGLTPYFGTWFKFKATTADVAIKTIGKNRGYVSIMDADFNLLKCVGNGGTSNNMLLQYPELEIDDWYYICVSNNSNDRNYTSSFSLELKNSVNYDFYQGAIEIPHQLNWSSSENEYTLAGSTSTGPNSCGDRAPINNRWFRFIANSTQCNITYQGGNFAWVTLWDSNLNTVTCKGNGSSSGGYLKMGSPQLIEGETYYISVGHAQNNVVARSFTLGLTTEVDYDFHQGAQEIPHQSSWVSEENQFTLAGSTNDGPNSCNDRPPIHNVWFKFAATSNFANISLSGVGFAWLTIWDENLQPLGCAGNGSSSNDILKEFSGLEIGQEYYVSVGQSQNNVVPTEFTIGLSNEPTFDFMEGAIEIPHQEFWESEEQEFTTYGATADGPESSCHSPFRNVWFKFQATSASFTLNYKGTREAYASVFDAENLSQVDCKTDHKTKNNILLSNVNLEIGKWYYISIGHTNGHSSMQGPFGLNLSNVAYYDYKEGAREVPHQSFWLSEDGEFTTQFMRNNGPAGTCLTEGPLGDVWFKFRASSEWVTVKASEIYQGYLNLFDDNFNIIECYNRGKHLDEELNFSYNGLEVGNWYYFSIGHNWNTEHDLRKAFDLEVTNEPSYDYIAGAKEITHSNIWNSAIGTTVGMTGDGPSSSCSTVSPQGNVWYKFQATSSELMTYLEGGISKVSMSLWDNNLNEIKCFEDDYSTAKFSLSYDNLTIGDWYYISVDNTSVGLDRRGDFEVSISNVLRPTVPVSNVTFTDHTENSFKISWKNGNGLNTLILARKWQLPTSSGLAEDGNVPNWSTDFKEAPGYGSSKALYVGSDTSITITGLEFNTYYGVRIYQFNGVGSEALYGVSIGKSQYTLGAATEPTIHSSQVKIHSVNANSIGISWTPGDGEYRLIRVRSNQKPTSVGVPLDGIGYSSETDYQKASARGPNKLISAGSDTTILITGLAPNQRYGFQIMDYNGVDSLTNYLPGGPMFLASTFNGNGNDVDEINALKTIYNSLNGTNWSDNTGWPASEEEWASITSLSQVVDWYGVNLNFDSTDVAYLWLAENNLLGEIPDGISNLQGLEYLDLSSNAISGNVPASLSLLTNLRDLNLSGNSLSGGFSDDLLTLPLLLRLNLSDNDFSGSITIPAEVADVTMLQELDLGGNSYSATLPTEISLLEDLQVLRLDSNSLSGELPGSLSELYYLKELDISSNSLSGLLPANIGRPQQFRALYAQNNNFSGDVASTYNDLTQLRVFNLSNNQFTGELPGLDASSYIKELVLSSNNFEGLIPLGYSGLDSLEVLKLGNNKINGDLNNALQDLPSLKSLHLDHTQLSGAVPEHFVNLVSLEELNLSSSFFTGFPDFHPGSPVETDPDHPDQVVPGNVDVDISNNYISDSDIQSNIDGGTPIFKSFVYSPQKVKKGNIPDLLEIQVLKEFYYATGGDGWSNNSGWPSSEAEWDQITILADFGRIYGLGDSRGDVSELDLDGNNLIGSLPASLSTLSLLVELNLSDNQLSGELPFSIADFQELRELNISNNEFTGSLEKIIGASDELEILDLSNNSFGGEIPSLIGGLSALQTIYLQHNNLLGAIPTEVGNLTAIEYMDFSNNTLSGNIPSSLVNLNVQRELNLSHNSLTGTIPSLSNNLAVVDLSYNQLEGSIPSTIFNQSVSKVNLSNNRLTGTVPAFASNSYFNYLDLSHNQLSGSLPVSLRQLTFKSLDVSYNELAGQIPLIIRDDRITDSLVFAHNHFESIYYYSPFNSNRIYLDVSDNNLSFEDIKPYVSAYRIDTYLYAPQANIPLYFDDESMTFSVELETREGVLNKANYEWVKNETVVKSGRHDYLIIQPEDYILSNVFQARMTHPDVPLLTIYSETDPIFIQSGVFYSIGDGDWSDPSVWSYSPDGPPALRAPGSSDQVYIQDHHITVGSSSACHSLELIVENAATSLTVDGSTLNMYGDLKLSKKQEGHPANVYVVNGGKIKINETE